MIRLITNDSRLTNEAAEIIRAFFPDEAVDISSMPSMAEYSVNIIATWMGSHWRAALEKDGKLVFYERSPDIYANNTDDISFRRAKKDALKRAVYSMMKKFAQRSLPYGMLTGVHPVTIALKAIELSGAQAVQALECEYDLSKEKALLLTETALVQKQLLPAVGKPSLYVNIPFCTTRCSYCSFPSELIDRAKPQLKNYMDSLKKELEFVLNSVDANFESIYVGGGTPTSLPDEYFYELCMMCCEAVRRKSILEFTIEAGRPDTITTEKLKMMKEAGVTRISINPQTMNDVTLQRIGRSHTAKDIISIFQLARRHGFDNINMDLILGLEGESASDMLHSLENVIKLNPDGITIHVLAIKHSSKLHQEGLDIFKNSGAAAKISQEIIQSLNEHEYFPYYLYRQKYMLDNLENTGYCKDGKICLYNIRMMDDLSTCWAVGAGAVSKRCFGSTKRIERQANVKNINEYILRTEEMLRKKAFLINQ